MSMEQEFWLIMLGIIVCYLVIASILKTVVRFFLTGNSEGAVEISNNTDIFGCFFVFIIFLLVVSGIIYKILEALFTFIF